MRPGERKFVVQKKVVLVEAYAQRDEPPGRDPVGLSYTVLAETEKVILPQHVPSVIKETLR